MKTGFTSASMTNGSSKFQVSSFRLLSLNFKLETLNLNRSFFKLKFFFNIPVKPLFFTVVLGLFLVAGCENDKDEITKVTALDKAPLESIRNLETIYSDSGIIKVKVNAPLLYKYTVPKVITELPKGLHIEFYDDDLKVVSQLTAKYAIHYEAERKWEARKDVVVINKKNEQLNTERLIWDERTEKISSDKFVKITTTEEIIYGDGFESDQNFTSYKIFKVKGHITVKE